MNELEKANEIMFSKLADGLDSTSRLTRALLTEIREGEADFAVIKTELAILRENVKSLSVIVKEGNGSTSLLTKIALIEQKLNVLDKWVDSQNEQNQKIKNKLTGIKSEIEDLERRIRTLEQTVKVYVDKTEEKERLEQETMRASIHRNEELAHLEEKNRAAIKKEKTENTIKVIVGIVVGIITICVAAAVAFFK